jgi:hypothetical protein
MLAATVATGCGTTVSESAAPTAGPGADTLSVPGGSDSSTTGTGGGTTGSLTTTGPGGYLGPGTSTGATDTTGGTDDSTGGSSGIGTTGGGTGVGPTGSAPGVTPTKIYVGLVYAVNNDALNKSAGANGIAVGDTQANGNAIVDDVNKHGGIAGRTVVPVWHPFDATSTQTLDAQWASVCAYFTQDHRVFAAVGQGVPSYRACLAKAGVVQLDADLPAISDAEFERYPTLVELGYPRMSRIAKAQLAALAGQKYFAPWNTTLGRPGTGKAKVGILTYDEPSFAYAVDNVLVPGLRRLGYDPSGHIARITPVSTAGDYGSQAAAVQSAQLKFASDGVTHIVVFEGNGGLSLFFMNQAEAQQYHPRYGVNSTSGLEVLIEAGDVQRDQARGALGFGFMPGIDLPEKMNPDNGRYSNSTRRQCLAAFKQHDIEFSNANAELAGLGYCSTLYLLRRTLDRTPHTITPATFVASLDGLGSSFISGGALGNTFAPGRHDSASKGYYWRYFDDCQCLHYTGKLRTIPY